MKTLVIIIIVVVVLLLALIGYDTIGVHDKVADGTVVGKEFVPSHTEWNHTSEMLETIDDCWKLSVRIGNDVATFECSEDAFNYYNTNDVVSVNYGYGRVTKQLLISGFHN